MNLQDLALQILVVTMMVSIGLDLEPRALRELGAQRRAFGLGLVLNLIAFPGLTFAATQLFDIEAAAAAGLMLCAVAPGGPIGPVFARLAKGHLAFAAALMVALSVAGLFTIPASAGLLAGSQVDGGSLFAPMLKTLALFQVAPLGLAMLFRARFRNAAERLARPARLLSNLALLAVIVGLVAARGALLLDVPASTHLLLIGLLLVFLAPLLRPDADETQRASAPVTAVRNLSVALLLCARFFPDPRTEVIILAWGFWMMLLPGLATWRVGRRRTSID